MPQRGPTTAHKDPPRVLVIDDDAELCELLTLRLEHHGYAVEVATTARAGLARLGQGPLDVMILDLRLRDADGLDVLSRVQERAPDLHVVMLTAHGSIESAVEAMRRGAFGFLTKPFHDHELLQTLAHAVENSSLRREVAGLREILGEPAQQPRLLGTSSQISKVREVIHRIGPTDATVLISGESGTGKELAARLLHSLSPRAAHPFVAVNCGAMPPDLLESELFGHVRGSFTGATQDRDGLFATANLGTLFLDEVGEASPDVQVKLLRVLQERRYTRVGSNQEEAVDVRVIAATNQDLRAAVAEKKFREDLFYRLHVVPITMPPLREHPEDIPLLAELFLQRAAARHGLAVPRMSRSAGNVLLGHDWPGNIRELANVMEGALLLADAHELRDEHLLHLTQAGAAQVPRLPARPGESPSGELDALHRALLSMSGADGELPSLKEARDAFERAYLVEVLERSHGNVSAAARAASRNRTDFYELLRRHGLSPTDFKST